MPPNQRSRGTRGRFFRPTFYERSERAAVAVWLAPISAVVAPAAWRLAAVALAPADRLDPAHPGVFRAVLAVTPAAIVAPGFEHPLPVVPERRGSVVRVRPVAPIAPPVAAREAIAVDVEETGPAPPFAPAAATLAPGAVHRLVRDRDRCIPHERGPAWREDAPRADRGAARDGADG